MNVFLCLLVFWYRFEMLFAYVVPNARSMCESFSVIQCSFDPTIVAFCLEMSCIRETLRLL